MIPTPERGAIRALRRCDAHGRRSGCAGSLINGAGVGGSVVGAVVAASASDFGAGTSGPLMPHAVVPSDRATAAAIAKASDEMAGREICFNIERNRSRPIEKPQC